MEQWLQGSQGDRVVLGDDEYSAIARPLLASEATATMPASSSTAASIASGAVVVLRSRTERLRPLQALHRALAAIAVTAVLLATLVSYFVARTVTRPIRAITATMRRHGPIGRPDARDRAGPRADAGATRMPACWPARSIP